MPVALIPEDFRGFLGALAAIKSGNVGANMNSGSVCS